MPENLPVIDLQRLSQAAELAALHDACANWGFFQLQGHGISTANQSALLAEMRRFFSLPVAAKQAIARSADNPWGYFDQELTKNRRDWKEIFDFGLDQNDGVISSRSQWPDLPGFRERMDAWYAACNELSQRLLATIIDTLGAPGDELLPAFRNPNSSFLRLNHYPPCAAPESHLGISHHTDAGAVTLLLTDGVSGLQVDQGGSWFTVRPEPDALIVNIGDLIEIWSNRRYRAPSHRVLAGPERYSAAFFLNPTFDTVVAPLPDEPPRYRPLNWGEFRSGRAAGDFADYGAEVQISDYLLPNVEHAQ